MNFITARDAIFEVIESPRRDEHKRFIIAQVLRSVAKYEDDDSANGLIQLFDLNMFAIGGFDWFGDDDTRTRPLISQEHLLAEIDMERKYSKSKISMKGIE